MEETKKEYLKDFMSCAGLSDANPVLTPRRSYLGNLKYERDCHIDAISKLQTKINLLERDPKLRAIIEELFND